jgi:hypothetical protein
MELNIRPLADFGVYSNQTPRSYLVVFGLISHDVAACISKPYPHLRDYTLDLFYYIVSSF